MNITNNNNRIDIVKQIEQDINNNNGKLYIYGCAKTAERITQFVLNNTSLHIEEYIVDDKYYKEGTFLDRQIISYSEWVNRCEAYDTVIIGFTGQDIYSDIIDNLPSGIKGYYFFFPYSFNAYGTLLDYKLYKDNYDKFEKVYNYLHDDLSKNTLQEYINACISGDIDKLDKYRMDGQYFNDLTKDQNVKCFVDCGAYTGDTIEQVFDFYPNTINNVIAFEPDNNNILLLNDRIKDNELSGILTLVNKGAWKEKDILYFSSSDSSSNICTDGDIKVEVDSIDNIVSDSVNVDYIKMDIEGSENEALYGAQKTISRCNPILAVCVYHRPEDIYILFETILHMVQGNNYSFYLRYHGPDLRELVLYAIPY